MGKLQGVKEFYDDSSKMWADEWYENLTMMPFLKKVKETLPKNAKVLDLGCNCGYETSRMKQLGLNAMGLDFSNKCIEIAREKNKDIKFVCDDMLNDLTYLGEFDAVVAIASIIHIPLNKLSLGFSRIYDILKKDGYLFLVVRKDEGKLEASYEQINNVEYDREVYGYSKNVIEEKMSSKFEFINEYIQDDRKWMYLIYKKAN